MSSPDLPAASDPAPVAANLATPQIPSGTRRSVLGDASSATSGTRRVTRASARLNASASSSSTPLINPPPTRPQSNARIQVFVDTPIDVSSTLRVSNEDEPPSAWPDLGTRKSRIKENVQEATKAAGTTLKQTGRSHRAAATANTPKISVFRDPDPQEEEENSTITNDEAPLPVPRPIPVKVPKSRSTKPVAVFCDDRAQPSGQPESKRPKLGKGIAVFQDKDTSPCDSAEKTTESTSSKKGPIPVFRDDVESMIIEPKKKSSSRPKGKSPMSGPSLDFSALSDFH